MNKKLGLVLYTHPVEANASTIMEHVNSFEQFSEYSFLKLNLLFKLHEKVGKRLFHNVDLIVVHYSAFMTVKLSWLQTFFPENVLVVGFFQDEMHNCEERFKWIDQLGVDIVYTCLTSKDSELVYGRCNNVKLIQETLTGYVDESLITKANKLALAHESRSVDIGYRARELPFFMGRGAQEKSEIGKEILRRLENSHLNLDIKVNEKDRLYARDWDLFLSDCKSMLTVEAGTSIFDLDGSIEAACDDFLQKYPDASFQQVENAVLEEHEEKIYYRTVSPRVFECAAFRTLIVGFEGRYTNVMKPNVHYLSLKKDYSNLDEIVNILSSPDEVQKITDRAYNDLIAKGEYSYRSFVREFDQTVSQYFEPRGQKENDFLKHFSVFSLVFLTISYERLMYVREVLYLKIVRPLFDKMLNAVRKRERLRSFIKRLIFWDILFPLLKRKRSRDNW